MRASNARAYRERVCARPLSVAQPGQSYNQTAILMNWYYVEAGEQAGPVNDAQLQGMVQSGRIQSDTLIWREGMPDWLPYREVMPAARPAEAPVPKVVSPVPAAVVSAPVPSASSEPVPEAVCAQCSNMFPVDQMNFASGSYFCTNCRPAPAGAKPAVVRPGEMEYAGFWTRFCALFIDGLVIGVLFGVLAVGGVAVLGAVGKNSAAALSIVPLLCGLLGCCLPLLYETIMIGTYGATLGKMACKVRIVTADGGKVSYLRAFARNLSRILSSAFCFIGYIIAAFDSEKRTLHDRICCTRAIMT